MHCVPFWEIKLTETLCSDTRYLPFLAARLSNSIDYADKMIHFLVFKDTP